MRADMDPVLLKRAQLHTSVAFGHAVARIRELPTLDAPVLPDHSILEQIIAATALPAV